MVIEIIHSGRIDLGLHQVVAASEGNAIVAIVDPDVPVSTVLKARRSIDRYLSMLTASGTVKAEETDRKEDIKA